MAATDSNLLTLSEGSIPSRAPEQALARLRRGRRGTIIDIRCVLMREPPATISTDEVRASLRADYCLDVAELIFLHRGADSSAWVYRVRTADAGTYFLKVRTRVANAASVLVPRYLHDRGIAQVVAPLPTATGALWTQTGEYALILYPFVAGPTGMEHGMSAQQWIEFGGLLRQIHNTGKADELERVMRRDAFTPDGADVVRKLDAHIAGQTFDEPVVGAFATFWQTRRSDIRSALERAETLGPRLAAAAPEFVLCHADIHTNNVLLDASAHVWITDWDETILAPRERDLMFVIGGIIPGVVGPREEAQFFQGYGPTSVDQVGLAYYRYCWAVSDIAAYGEAVCFRPDLGLVTRRAAVESFMKLFKPGYIVERAFGSEVAW